MIAATCYAQNIDTLKSVMNNHLKPKGKKPVHSIQIYISKEDTIFNEAVGYADGKEGLADRNNQFKIANITKTMTAVVILQMQEEEKLKITDTAAKYLNNVKYVRANELHYFDDKAYGNSITIQQLLQHTSGLADIFTDAAIRFYTNAFLHKQQQQWNPEKLISRYYK